MQQLCTSNPGVNHYILVQNGFAILIVALKLPPADIRPEFLITFRYYIFIPFIVDAKIIGTVIKNLFVKQDLADYNCINKS